MELRWVHEKFPQMVSSHQMKKFLHKGVDIFISQLCSLNFYNLNSFIHPNLQENIDDHSRVFGEMPKELHLKKNHDHSI